MDSHTSTHLFDWRLRASELSRGASAEEIYTIIDNVLLDANIKGSVLDYGAGIGNLSKRALWSQLFDQIFAADIMEKPEGLDGVTWITGDLNNPIHGFDSAFDVIVAAEVIEHLENPRAMLRELFRLCRPGGLVIVTTPNNESVRARISLFARGHYVAFNDSCYPAHITALLRKDLTRICQEAGFEAPAFRFTNVGGFPGFPRFTWQSPSLGLFRGLHFSDNLLAVARKPSHR